MISSPTKRNELLAQEKIVKDKVDNKSSATPKRNKLKFYRNKSKVLVQPSTVPSPSTKTVPNDTSITAKKEFPKENTTGSNKDGDEPSPETDSNDTSFAAEKQIPKENTAGTSVDEPARKRQKQSNFLRDMFSLQKKQSEGRNLIKISDKCTKLVPIRKNYMNQCDSISVF